MGANVKGYNDTTVHNGLNYSYYVVAVNIIGESLPTETIGTVPMTKPSVPLNFIVKGGDEKVDLTWEGPIDDGGSPVTGYRVLKVSGDDPPAFIDLEETFYSDTEVENGITYTYSIACINSVGISPWTGEAQAIPATIPSPPEIELISRGSDHIQIGWTQPSYNGGNDILSFELYRGEGPDNMVLYRVFEPDRLQFNDTNVVTGIELHYAISAVNGIGPSEVIETVVAAPVGIPSPPHDISFELHDLEIWISWMEPVDNGGSPIIRYAIQRTEIISKITTTSDHRGDDNLYKDLNVQPGVAYQYRIHSINSIGHSVLSESIEVTAYRAPSPIEGLEVRSTGSTVELTWTALDLTETGEVSIEVQRNIGPGEFRTVAVLEGTATTFTDENVRDDVIYGYRLIASNDAGSSESSSIDLDLTDTSSSSISAGSIIIMVLGTLIPLMIAGIFVFLIIKGRRSKEPVTEDIQQNGSVENGVMTASMETLPQPSPTTEMAPPPVVQEQLPPTMTSPLTEPIAQEQLPTSVTPPVPGPVGQELPVPVQEEVPLQEEPGPFMEQTPEEPPSPNDEFFKEVMQ
jgi:titin